jgi:predicted NBD/HSP70 family sugar kinase/biotin operon repressor
MNSDGSSEGVRGAPTGDPPAPSGVRASNRDRILALLRARGPMSQADLARASGLSPATISSIARELREDGWLDESDGETPARGRALALNRSAGVAVGIDFGHSHVRVAIADLAHTVLAEAEEALDVDHEAHEGVALAGRLVRALLDEVDVGTDRVTGVGMGLPAPLRRDTGEVGDSAILPGWIGARPEELMRTELGLAVRVENDANLGALAEIVWGAGRGCTDLVYVKVATGVGAGLVLNARLYHGSSGTAGELGHMTIDEGGPVCRCGNRGCLEAFAGAEAVLEPLRRRHGERLTLRQVVLQAQAGDVGCRRVVADAGRALGIAVAGVCNLLAPERVLVGGELAQAGEVLLEPLRASLGRSAIAATREVPVLAGVLGERAEVLGAVALVLRESQRFVAEPAPAAGTLTHCGTRTRT